MSESKNGSEAGSLGFALAVIYGTGLVTTNVFLRSLGLADFSLIKPKAIFIGAIVLGSLALLAAGPIQVLASLLDRNHARSLTRWFWAESTAKLLLPFVIATWVCWDVSAEPGLGTVFLGIHLPQKVHPHFQHLRGSVLLAIQFYFLSLLTCTFAVETFRFLRAAKVMHSFAGVASRLTKLTALLVAVLFFLGLYIDLFATDVFPRIPQAIGGGAPVEEQFIVQNDSLAELKALGITFSNDRASLTDSLLVVYESDDFFAVVVQMEDSSFRGSGSNAEFEENTWQATVKLDRKIVKGVIRKQYLLFSNSLF